MTTDPKPSTSAESGTVIQRLTRWHRMVLRVAHEVHADDVEHGEELYDALAETLFRLRARLADEMVERELTNG